MNLSKMSLAKLEASLKAIQKEIKGRKSVDAKRAKAKKELAALAKKYGMSVSDLTGRKGKAAGVPVKKRRKAKAKYRNPANKAETWSGRGRPPKWFVAAVKKLGGKKKLEI